jgi:hypothetical protein
MKLERYELVVQVEEQPDETWKTASEVTSKEAILRHYNENILPLITAQYPIKLTATALREVAEVRNSASTDR